MKSLCPSSSPSLSTLHSRRSHFLVSYLSRQSILSLSFTRPVSLSLSLSLSLQSLTTLNVCFIRDSLPQAHLPPSM
ncbi:hypothetical protein Scep_021981 [Stephania cephalantha]|uniref:Uncharacterized protein n=1 Tax=Stephania cephalantha TaxID=152367 RepID=A0AAP0FA06_9MAGN